MRLTLREVMPSFWDSSSEVVTFPSRFRMKASRARVPALTFNCRAKKGLRLLSSEEREETSVTNMSSSTR